MLLNIARAAVTWVQGHHCGPLGTEATHGSCADGGFPRIMLPAKDRAQYMLALRAWHAQNKDVLLWCNGLVPR